MTINVDSAFHENRGHILSAGHPGRFCLDVPEIHPDGHHPSIYNRNPLIRVGRGKGIVVGVCPVHVSYISRIEGRNRRVFLLRHTRISQFLGPAIYSASGVSLSKESCRGSATGQLRADARCRSLQVREPLA
jgi:hypothetical protein